MAVISNAPDDENEDDANNIPTPENDPTVSGTDSDTDYQVNLGSNPNGGSAPNNNAVPDSSGANPTQTGAVRPTATSQVANPSGFTNVSAYENGNQDAINYLAGETQSDLNNQINNTNTNTQNATNQATQAVNSGTPQYSASADQDVTSNPTDTTTADYGTVVDNLLGTYSGPSTVNPYYTGATQSAENATQAGQLLTQGTPEGTQEYLENNQGIEGAGNSLLDAYLVNQNPTAQQEIQPLANQALGTSAAENVAIGNGNSTLIPNAQTTATTTQQQTQQDVTNALNNQEASAEGAVSSNISNYQNTENEIDSFLANPTAVGATPTAAQSAVLSALNVTPTQWNQLVQENTQLQQANYVNQLITQDKQQILQNPDGSYVYTATGAPVQFPSSLSSSGVDLASSFTPLDPTSLYNLQNSVTPAQAQDIAALQTLLGQSSEFINPNSLTSGPTNLFSYNPTTVGNSLQSALQTANGLTASENAANAPPPASTSSPTGTSTVPSVPGAAGTGALKAATAATAVAGGASLLQTLGAIKQGSSLWNSIVGSTGVTPTQLAADLNDSTGAIDAATQTQLNSALSQINSQTQAQLDSQLTTETSDLANAGETGIQNVGTNAIGDAADLGDTTASNALGDVASDTEPALEDVGTDAISDAANADAAEAADALGSGSSALGSAIPIAGAAYALYNAVANYQSGATGADALNGAEAGAAIGSAIVPGIGTAIGAVIGGVVGGIASAFGPGKTDPETTDWNSYLTAVQANPDLATQVSNPFLLLAGMFDEKSSTVPIYNTFGRMGEDKFTVAMTQQINNAFQSGAINASSTPTQVYASVVSPWMQTMGNWSNVGSQYQQAIGGLVQQMIAQFMGGKQTNWDSVGGGYAFTGGSQGSITPYLGYTPPPAAPVPIKSSGVTGTAGGKSR